MITLTAVCSITAGWITANGRLASCSPQPGLITIRLPRGTATAFSYGKEKAEPLRTLSWREKWCLYRLLVLVPSSHRPAPTLQTQGGCCAANIRDQAEQDEETAQPAPSAARAARSAAGPVSGAATALRRAANAIQVWLWLIVDQYEDGVAARATIQ